MLLAVYHHNRKQPLLQAEQQSEQENLYRQKNTKYTKVFMNIADTINIKQQ
jgi:shikimate kinase